MPSSHSFAANERRLFEEAGLRAMQKPQTGGSGNGFNPASLEGVDGRMRAGIALPFDILGQYAFGKIPGSDNPILGSILYAAKKAGQEYFKTNKHNHGKVLLETPFKGVPILGKIVQNGWSVLNLAGGLTTIDSLYAIRDTRGVEAPIYLMGRGEQAPDMESLNMLAKEALNGNKAVYGNVIEHLKKLENDEATLADCYAELTDGDIKQVIDPKEFKPHYMQQELWLTGRKGKRSVLATDQKTGIQIIKYDRPSPLDLLAFHGLSDVIYTGIDVPFEPLEGLFSDVAKQSFYVSEVQIATGAARILYGGRRDDGYNVPLK